MPPRQTEGEMGGGDMPELDDCEEDDHFDPEDEWDDEVWAGYTKEQIEQFKILGARLEAEEVRKRMVCMQRVRRSHKLRSNVPRYSTLLATAC